jgi:hypothetical protein
MNMPDYERSDNTAAGSVPVCAMNHLTSMPTGEIRLERRRAEPTALERFEVSVEREQRSSHEE